MKRSESIKAFDPIFSVQSARVSRRSGRSIIAGMKITVYEKPTCTKCREMDRFLRESGVPFEKVNYYLEPLSETKLGELIRKMGIKPRDLLRTSEPVYRQLGLAKGEFSDDQIVALMVQHPDLIQRPIIEKGNRAVLGRPVENVKQLL